MSQNAPAVLSLFPSLLPALLPSQLPSFTGTRRLVTQGRQGRPRRGIALYAIQIVLLRPSLLPVFSYIFTLRTENGAANRNAPPHVHRPARPGNDLISLLICFFTPYAPSPAGCDVIPYLATPFVAPDDVPALLF